MLDSKFRHDTVPNTFTHITHKAEKNEKPI